MTEFLLVIHLLIAVALIGVVLLQRSEGGALGIGSGGAGSLFTSRGAANVLTRTTAVLAIAFFVTSIALTLIARKQHAPSSVFDQQQPSATGQPSSPQGGNQAPDILPNLPPANQSPQVPVGQ
ncbi:MAG TPA: preprotein translocase subunit SecG [Aestuariivirgaceae bacterium]|jgi:preprotein translocase subunit SecG